MLQPINAVSGFYNKTINFKNNSSTNSQTLNRPKNTETSELLNYFQQKDKNEQKEKMTNTIMSGILFASSIGLLFFMPKMVKKATSNTVSGAEKFFYSLKNDKSVPTLDSCKSINPDLRKFLENQVMFAKATKEDLIKTGSPSSANRLLMCGDPGSGKSFFAKIFAKTLGADYMEVKYSDLNKRYCGEHLENVKNIFDNIIKTAQKEPNKKFVVNFNEIDALARPIENLQDGASSHNTFKMEERSVFLTYIEELANKTPNVTLIGSTNIIPQNGGFDGAIISRFQNVVKVSNPDKNCMLEALKANILTLPEGKEFVNANMDKLEKLASDLVARKASYRNLNQVVDSSKNSYLKDVIKDKKSSFKMEYLEDAKNSIGFTDGELANANRR